MSAEPTTSRLLAILLVAALAVSACSKASEEKPVDTTIGPPVSAAAEVEPKAPKSKVQAAFDLGVGSYLPKLEQLIGLPDTVIANTRYYNVDGCNVVVQTAGNNVEAIGLRNISERCQFELRPGLSVANLTFRAFEQAVGGLTYKASCLTMCGNAVDPSVYGLYEGSHAEGFVRYTAEAQVVSDSALEAAARWSTAMQEAEGEDYVFERKFNCDTKYEQVARDGLATVKIEAIYVGSLDLVLGCQ